MLEIFKGDDGKPSGRRIIGAICIAAGIAAGFVAIFADGDWVKFIPMAAMLFTGLFLWGLITIQNIQDITKAVKGDK